MKTASVITALVALVVLLALPATAHAIDDPDTLTIKDHKAFRNLLETDDFLLVIHYEITYDPTAEPGENANVTFLVQIVDTDDVTVLGFSVPFAFQNGGYDEGVVGIYWTAADAPTWGVRYLVRLQGNPDFFVTAPTTTSTIALLDFSTEATATGQQDALGDLILLDIVPDLEQSWTSTFNDLADTTTEGLQLNANGLSYFKQAIQQIENMSPGIAPARIISPSFPTPVAGGGVYADELAGRFDGTFIGDAVSSTAEDWGVSKGFVWGGFTMVAFMGVIVLGFMMFKESPSQQVATVLVALPVLFVGTLFGMPVQILFILLLFAILIIATALWLGRA